MPSGKVSDKEAMLAMHRMAVFGQRAAIVAASEAFTLASTQAEYIVGALMALVSAKYLVPSAFSLLGGLAEALLNNKAMFPGSQHGAWILILTTCEVVPVYAALLAMLQQLVGDAVLAVACVCALLYGSLGIVTGLRILSIKNGNAEREKLYKRIWFEYALRVAAAAGIAISIAAWIASKHAGLQNYVQNELFSTQVIVFAAIDILAKKVVTAIGGTDLIQNAFLRTELWSAALPLDAKENHQTEVMDVAMLFKLHSGDQQTNDCKYIA